MFQIIFNTFVFLSLCSIMFSLARHEMLARSVARALATLLGEIQGRLERIEELVTPDQDFSDVWFFTTIDGQKKRIFKMFLKATQSLPLSIEVKDKFGNAAKVDGDPKWSLTDEAAGTITPDSDSFSAVFVPSGKAGVFKAQVRVDADLGEGVTDLIGEIEIEVVAGEAVVVEIAAGEPVDTVPVEP